MKKSEKLAPVRRYYPNALTTADTADRLTNYLEEHLDLEPAQIMLADSICSDDVNSIQYPLPVRGILGPFKMGGLDGFPFVGVTGMGAYASHVPDGGTLLIYYGPHIGITKSGALGEIHRFGHSKNSGSCGAAKAALGKLKANAIEEGHVTDLDYQMNTLEQILLKQKDRVLGAAEPLHEATEVIYEATDARMQELVAKTTYNCKYVVLVGAVLINGDSDVGSFSAPKRFDVIDVTTGKRESHLEACFG